MHISRSFYKDWWTVNFHPCMNFALQKENCWDMNRFDLANGISHCRQG